MKPIIINKIALIGASDKSTKYGNIILKDLLKKEYAVYPVHPALNMIEGQPVIQQLDQLPSDCDLMVFVVPPAVSLSTTQKAISKGFTRFWYQPGAYDEQLKALASEYGDLFFSFQRCIMLSTYRKGDLEI